MSSAVNKPVDIKAKEADVNAKLQLYGIYTAFANGKVPSNKQIDVALNSLLASKALNSPSDKLSAEGQKLVADTRNVIEKAKMLVLVKNHGNLLQDFIWQSQQISGGDFSTPDAPVGKDQAKKHGNDALGGLRQLGTLIITNGQFRKLLDDALILARDMAGDAATSAASRVNPSDDQLRQIDQPAADNTWHDAPDTKELKEKYANKVPFSKKDAQNIADDAAKTGQNPDGSVDPQLAAKQAASNVSAQIPEEDKEKAKEKAKEKRAELQAKSKDYWNEKMPAERREQTIWRLKKMVVEIQGHQDYLQAVETLLNLAEMYGKHSKDVADQSQGAVKGAHTDDSLNKAEADLKTLIERCANGTSLDDTFDSIKALYDAAEKDPELKGWFRNLNAYVRKCLKEQGYIMQDSAKEEWDRLYDQGRYLLREKYRAQTNRTLDHIKFVGKQFDEDKQNKEFGFAVQKLFQDLGNDASGKPQFKPHLVKDLTDVILPALFEHIRYVPIPRIEVSDPQVDAIVENLVIEGDNLAPNVLEFGSDNYWRWGRKSVANKNKNKIMLAVSGVQCDLRDVSYYFKKKQGFPSITDKGVFDIFLGGTGFSFKIQMETSDTKDKNHYFKVDKVSVDVKHFDIKVKQSNHKILFSVFKPLLTKAIRPVVEKVLEKQIKESATQLDGFLARIKDEADKAAADAQRDPSPENVKNIWQRYYDAGQKQIMQGKQKKEEIESKTQVNVAMTQHESIFKDIKLPQGISTAATEYKNKAREGDKWESPVFSLGSAAETSSVPAPPAPTRKPVAPSTGTTTNTTTAATNGFRTEVNQAFDTGVYNEKSAPATTLGQPIAAQTPINQGTI